MDASAPQFLVALEASGLGQVIRQSAWLYPAANVLHVVSVVSFTAAVAVMDFALLGWLGYSNLVLARRARAAAITLFCLVVATGVTLFIAEASHVALNRVFQLKLLFIVLAGLNALLLGRSLLADESGEETTEANARAARIAAVLSLGAWLVVVALGRLIAYY